MSEEHKPKFDIIPYREKPYSKAYITIAILAIIGLLALILIWSQEDKLIFCLRMLALSSIILVAALIQAKFERRHWVRISATVLDSDITVIHTRHKPLYNFRLLCEFEYHGTQYTATPELHWKSYTKKQQALDKCNSLISKDHQCLLWMNPYNPKQTELVTRGLRDKFLFRSPDE